MYRIEHTLSTRNDVCSWHRDHTVSDGLDYVATWNSAQMLSEDMQKVMQTLASKSREQPRFSKL